MNDPATGSRKDIPMTEEEFSLFRRLVEGEFGIVIKGDKRLTLHTKLAHRLQILGLASYTDYYSLIMSQASRDELYSFIAHITNNETYFQRETAKMGIFGRLLNEIKRAKQKKGLNRITVLSAGCSSGEEAYTLNIMLMESGLFTWGWEVKVIGIDVNRNALRKAEKASYTKNSFRLLNGNEEFARKYFELKDGVYVLKGPYRSSVEFRHGNLLDTRAFDGIGPVDVIFCRNVFIYMNDRAIRRVAENFHRHLADEGYLFIGSSESLLNKTNLFITEHREGNILYRKNPSLHTAR